VPGKQPSQTGVKTLVVGKLAGQTDDCHKPGLDLRCFLERFLLAMPNPHKTNRVGHARSARGFVRARNALSGEREAATDQLTGNLSGLWRISGSF
jgi:hypothetical protein